MKKVALIIIAVSIIGCVACGSSHSIGVVEQTLYSGEFTIYYVDESQIKENRITLPADISVIMNEWLRSNGLAEQYALLGVHVDDGLSGYSVQQSKSFFVYDSYTFYFSKDIITFLENDVSKRYYESLMSTLQDADMVISDITNNNIINK